MRWFWVPWLCIAAMTGAALAQLAQPLEIITLHHRRAEQLLPQLTPFVEPGGSLGGVNDTLFLRASSRNRAEIRQLAATLDMPLRRLVIHVRQESETAEDSSGAGVFGHIALSGSVPAVQGRMDIYQNERNSRRTTSQQVQTVDGGRAAILTGQSMLLPMRQVVLTPAGVVVAESFVQRDLGTGFVAVPRLAGDQVTLEISPLDDATGPLPGSVTVQRLTTTVSGLLGEWIALGGSSGEENTRQGEIAGHGAHLASRQRRLLLKVDELP